MQIALIDLGTASLRLEIYNCVQQLSSLQTTLIERKRYMPRLGQGLYQSGRLSPEGRRKAEEHFREIAQVISQRQPDLVVAVGTSALRDADDGEVFTTRVEAIIGHPLRIISGEEEARLTAVGVMSFEENLPDEFALVDIGGGSTEISLCQNGKIGFSVSLPLGAIRAKNIYLPDLPTKQEQITKLTLEIDKILAPLASSVSQFPQVELIVGTSGTIRMLCELHRQSSASEDLLALPKVIEITASLAGKSLAEIIALPGMESKRADIIVGGSLIFCQIMKFLGATTVIPSSYSLRHGLLVEAIRNSD